MKVISRKIRSSLFFSMVLVAALVVGFVVDSAQGKPKNIIICIGDGMGPQQVKAGGMFTYGAAGTLSFELFPYSGEITTYSANSGGPNSGATDSAAAATAIATGYKVKDRVISMAYEGYPPGFDEYTELDTLLEYFKDQGKMTGLVTTKFMTDATPAAFGAHDWDRGHTGDIADDYRLQTEPNVLFGGGGNGITTSEFSTAGYTVKTCWDTNRDDIEDGTGLKWLNTETAGKVLGYFGDTFLPFEYYNQYGDLPHLSEMTEVALQILDNEPNGFFLMMEGGRIDSAGHNRRIYELDPEMDEFNKAVQVVIDWAKGRTDTLILVVADHETGGLTVSSNGNNGAGNDPTVTWNQTGDHTDANVPIYTWGVNSELMSSTSDNTHIIDLVTADQPIELVRPVYDAVEVSTSPTLEVTVYDPDDNDSSLDVTFYGREDSFTIVALPDTQMYVLNGAHPEIFDSQTQWAARNADALNIVFVTHEGDITETYDPAPVDAEWVDANESMSLLDGFVPYGVLPGNHDTISKLNEYFPYTRYEDEYWYGGHYPSTGNENNYELFSAGGDDYIILHLEDVPNANVISWAGGVLDHYTNRKAIITTHSYINAGANFVGGGQDIWNNLIDDRGNVHFVLCGHVDDERYNGRTANDGHTVHELLADYQGVSGHGDGYLRIMEFVPSANSVNVYTYSPWRDEYRTGGDSQFPINNFEMSGGAFSVIGSETGVESGSNVSTVWSGLSPETQYEWYVSIDDPTSGTTQGPSYLFETAVYWYVDGVNGDDANDGKTWATAFKTISKAINRSQDGHVIEVAEATYTEGIDFNGKRLTITGTDPGAWSTVANTIIYRSGGFYSRDGVVNFTSGEGADSILTGFTIKGDGKFTRDGIRCSNSSSPTVSNCIIENTFLGIDSVGCAPVIKNNKIHNNWQGIWCEQNSTAQIRNNWFYDNDWGVETSSSHSVEVIGNTITGNTYYGVWSNAAPGPIVKNCIIWDNSIETYNCTNVTHSCIMGGGTQNGNIPDDPCFVDRAIHDYHLREISHSINKGDSNAVIAGETDIDGEPRIQGCTPESTIVDMGADESPYNGVLCVSLGGNSDGRCWATAYGSIQEAIDAAYDGDIVDVNVGTYYETIDFKGKSITVRSTNPDDPNVVASTVIDANSDVSNPGRGVTFDEGEDANSVLTGFVITGGYAPGTDIARDGGGILCYGSSPTISKCDIIQNYAGDDGGGIFCDSGSDAEISDCTISDNESGDKGGGMYCRNSDSTIKDTDVSSNDAGTGGGLYYTASEPLIENCFITDNETTGGSSADGGGIYLLSSNATIISSIISDNISDDDAGGIYFLTGSDATITNCTLGGNQADDKGGGFYCKDGSDPAITNCIVWGNTATTGAQIHTATSSPVVSYSDVEGGWTGTGNINSEPAFADPANGDYYLLPSSPCIDAGDSNGDYAGQTDIEGDSRVIDIGGKGDGTVDVDMGANEVVGDVHNITQGIDYFSIQTAITDADPNDVIEVEEGTYYETLDFGGKSITLTSTDPDDSSVVLNTIIDANSNVNNPGRGVTFDDSEGPTSVLTGFTITGGYAPGTGNARDGGGILCDGSSPTISNCLITENYAGDDGGGIFCDSGSDAIINFCTISDNESGDKGGGMYCRNSDPTIKVSDITSNDAGSGGGLYFNASEPLIDGCIVSGNETSGGTSADGGGIYLLSSNATIINSVISDNISDDDAGGIYCLTGSDAEITNCTLTGNQADDKGGGFYCKDGSDAVITNCIVWGNTATTGAQIHTASSTPVVSYSDVEGGWTGTGNINSDPAFADAYHLQSNSPCIDEGDPNGNYAVQKDIDGEERVMGDEVDIGADEYTQ